MVGCVEGCVEGHAERCRVNQFLFLLSKLIVYGDLFVSETLGFITNQWFS